MSFITAIKECFSKFATFSGRAARPEFWWFFLFYVLMSLVLSLLDAALFSVDPATQTQPQYLSSLFSLIIFLPLLAVSFRRLHDSNRPGWYALLPVGLNVITIIGLLTGVLAFAHLAGNSADPEALRRPAALFGMFGLGGAMILSLALTVLMIYWMTRPTDPSVNAWGPPPSEFR